MGKMRIKTGDIVIGIAGKEKGKNQKDRRKNHSDIQRR